MPILNYSKYPFKINELERLDWDGLCFELHFNKKLNDSESKAIELSIDNWFKNGQKTCVDGFHFISDFFWSDKKTLKFWVDFGSADDNALESLLDLLFKNKTIINSLNIGETPFPSTKKYLYSVDSNPNINVSKYPYKVTILENFGSDWALSLYFKKQMEVNEKKVFEECLNDWFNEVVKKSDQKNPLSNNPWISKIEFKNDKTCSWWVGGRSGKFEEIFNDLIVHLEGFSKNIEELIIGARFPIRERINYRPAKL